MDDIFLYSNYARLTDPKADAFTWTQTHNWKPLVDFKMPTLKLARSNCQIDFHNFIFGDGKKISALQF